MEHQHSTHNTATTAEQSTAQQERNNTLPMRHSHPPPQNVCCVLIDGFCQEGSNIFVECRLIQELMGGTRGSGCKCKVSVAAVAVNELITQLAAEFVARIVRVALFMVSLQRWSLRYLFGTDLPVCSH